MSDNECPVDPYRSSSVALSVTLPFWMEGVAEVPLCLIGIITNAISIPILMSKKLATTFNRILVFLAVFDNLFLLCCILEAIRKFFFATDIHHMLFVYFLYQLQNFALLCSAFTTVVVAVERYFAVAKPVQYHLMVSTANPWCRVWTYMAPTILLAVLINFPKSFELKMDYVVVNATKLWNEDSETFEWLNVTESQIGPTSLRLNEHYSFYYVHLTRFFVTAIIPFLALLYLNYGIHRAMKKRRAAAAQLTNSHNNASSSSSSNNNADTEENRQSLVLIAIVLLFLICNIPRIVLNAYEFLNVSRMKSDPCFYMPSWVIVTMSSSLLLMTLNSSVNFFIYCFVNTTFRRALIEKMPDALKATNKSTQNQQQTFTSLSQGQRSNKANGKSEVAEDV